jgi:hypothetical protein
MQGIDSAISVPVRQATKPRGSDSSKPWNLFLGPLKVYKFELWTPLFKYLM